jgi:hypothetical protein
MRKAIMAWSAPCKKSRELNHRPQTVRKLDEEGESLICMVELANQTFDIGATGHSRTKQLVSNDDDFLMKLANSCLASRCVFLVMCYHR